MRWKIFFGHVQITSSAIHPIIALTSKTCAELATAGSTMPTTTAFPFQRIRVKGATQEIYLQDTTLTQDGNSVTENVTCGTKDQSLYTPYLCLDTRFVDVILRFSETHQSIQSIPMYYIYLKFRFIWLFLIPLNI